MMSWVGELSAVTAGIVVIARIAEIAGIDDDCCLMLRVWFGFVDSVLFGLCWIQKDDGDGDVGHIWGNMRKKNNQLLCLHSRLH